MIVTCPNCNVQFNLDDDLLGDTGRKVKCTSCDEIWFQEPENIVIEPEEEIIEEVIEEPVEEIIDTPKISEPAKPPVNNNDKGKIISIAIAASVFFVILTYFLVNSASFTQKHPSMYGFYALFGVKPDIAGLGLVFDQVKAVNNGKTINISGKIINLEPKDKVIPSIEASLVNVAGDIIAKWYISPPVDMLKSEGGIAFNSTHNINLEQGAELSATVRFVITAKTDLKTDEASDENNPAPHQGDLDHQSDHEESSKSHQPASSAPDQAASHH